LLKNRWPSSCSFRIDFNQEVREKLKGEELTNALALKIFKQVKLKSDILSFLTKPIVCISLLVAMTAIGVCLPIFLPATPAMVVIALGITGCLLAIVLGGIGADVLVRDVLANLISDDDKDRSLLTQLSQAYRDQSEQAAHYISQLETHINSAGAEYFFELAD